MHRDGWGRTPSGCSSAVRLDLNLWYIAQSLVNATIEYHYLSHIFRPETLHRPQEETAQSSTSTSSQTDTPPQSLQASPHAPPATSPHAHQKSYRAVPEITPVCSIRIVSNGGHATTKTHLEHLGSYQPRHDAVHADRRQIERERLSRREVRARAGHHVGEPADGAHGV